jgi:hypothetical protein
VPPPPPLRPLPPPPARPSAISPSWARARQPSARAYRAPQPSCAPRPSQHAQRRGPASARCAHATALARTPGAAAATCARSLGRLRVALACKQQRQPSVPASQAPARSPRSRVRTRQLLPPPCLAPLCPGWPTHACTARPAWLHAPRLHSIAPAAHMGGCPTSPLPWDPLAIYISLSPVFSPCFPTMHAPRPPIFSASRRTARKQQSPRPRQLPPPHCCVCSMAPPTSSRGRAIPAPARPASPGGDAWCGSRPTDQRARAHPCTRKRRYRQTRPRSRFVAVVLRSTSAW